MEWRYGRMSQIENVEESVTPGADPGGGGGVRWVQRPPLGRRDPRGFLHRKGRKKGHWCPLNGCSTPFKHNMAINILKSYKLVFAYVKNRSSPSHIRSSIPLAPSPGRNPGSAPELNLDSNGIDWNWLNSDSNDNQHDSTLTRLISLTWV